MHSVIYELSCFEFAIIILKKLLEESEVLVMVH